MSVKNSRAPREGSPRVYATHPRGGLAARSSRASSHWRATLFPPAGHGREPSRSSTSGCTRFEPCGSTWWNAKKSRMSCATCTCSASGSAEAPRPKGCPFRFESWSPPRAFHRSKGVSSRTFWGVRVVAEMDHGSDVVLSARFSLLRASAVAAPAALGRALPPVGRDRRSLVWADVAAKTGLHFTEETGELTSQVGSVKLSVAFERGGDRSHLVAHLAYDPLSLAIDLHSRRWTDAFGASEIDASVPRLRPPSLGACALRRASPRLPRRSAPQRALGVRGGAPHRRRRGPFVGCAGERPRRPHRRRPLRPSPLGCGALDAAIARIAPPPAMAQGRARVAVILRLGDRPASSRGACPHYGSDARARASSTLESCAGRRANRPETRASPCLSR